MASGHLHSHDDSRIPPGSVGPLARIILAVVLSLAAALTVFGLVRYWPHGDVSTSRVTSADFAAPGATFVVGAVTRVLPACAPGDPRQGGSGPGDGGTPGAEEATCGAIDVDLGTERATVPVPPAIVDSGLRVGDDVQLMHLPAAAGQPESYSFLQVQRGTPLVVLFVLFVAAVAAVARWKGLLSLVGLGFGGFVIVAFMLPALLEGQSGSRVALIGSSAIMFVVLYLAHGVSIRTSTAMAGTLFGVGITAVLGGLAVGRARLSGLSDDEAATLASFAQGMSLRELLTCAIIVAGLGVLNDVTITQSSAVWELRAASPSMTRREIFGSGMRIGRDHIASTIYTIVFAYAGAALPVLMLMFLYDRPVFDLLQTESMAEEIVRTLASAIGLVLAVPATTAIGALAVASAHPEVSAATPGREPSVPSVLPTASPEWPAPTTRAEARARAERAAGRPSPR